MSITDVSPFSYPSILPDSATVAVLDAAEEFCFAVIWIPKSGTLKKIGFKTGTITGSSYTLKISLEKVAESVGQPCATSNASKTLYATGSESDDITSLTSNTVTYVALNGSSGISVSPGLAVVTWRLTAVSGSTVRVFFAVQNYGFGLDSTASGNSYSGTYLGSSWSSYAYTPTIILDYSDGIYPTLFSRPVADNSPIAYNSGSSYPYIGIKFRYPFKCRLSGVVANIDADGDFDYVLYGSDEYTIMTTVAIKNTQRQSTSRSMMTGLFSEKQTIEANTYYRLIVLPKTSTSIILTNFIMTGDGVFSGMDAFDEGTDVIYTKISSAPSSINHVWTDDVTNRPGIQLIIDGIEASAGAAGGISRSRQLMG